MLVSEICIPFHMDPYVKYDMCGYSTISRLFYANHYTKAPRWKIGHCGVGVMPNRRPALSVTLFNLPWCPIVRLFQISNINLSTS